VISIYAGAARGVFAASNGPAKFRAIDRGRSRAFQTAASQAAVVGAKAATESIPAR